LQFSGDGHAHGKDDPRAMWRTISPGFFTALGVPIIAGRDFNALDDQNQEPVAVVSASLAQRMFPGQDPINRHVYWTCGWRIVISPMIPRDFPSCYHPSMRNLTVLFVQVSRAAGPEG
jgi:hypothetical protein